MPRVVGDSPPRCPREATERMKTSGCAPCSPMRTRSPSTAPPVMGLDGSTATTATFWPRRSSSPSNACTRVDLPAPGLPVSPSTCARPRCGASAACKAGAPGAARSTALMARASTCRCPARMPASSGCAAGTSPRSVTPGPARGRSPVPGATGRRFRRASPPPRQLRPRGRRGCPSGRRQRGPAYPAPAVLRPASGRCA